MGHMKYFYAGETLPCTDSMFDTFKTICMGVELTFIAVSIYLLLPVPTIK